MKLRYNLIWWRWTIKDLSNERHQVAGRHLTGLSTEAPAVRCLRTTSTGQHCLLCQQLTKGNTKPVMQIKDTKLTAAQFQVLQTRFLLTFSRWRHTCELLAINSWLGEQKPEQKKVEWRVKPNSIDRRTDYFGLDLSERLGAEVRLKVSIYGGSSTFMVSLLREQKAAVWWAEMKKWGRIIEGTDTFDVWRELVLVCDVESNW